MKRILIAGAASALVIGSVAFAQADQSGAYGNQDSAASPGAATTDDPASTTGAGAADTTTETTTETTTGAGADYAATGERG